MRLFLELAAHNFCPNFLSTASVTYLTALFTVPYSSFYQACIPLVKIPVKLSH